MGQSTFHRMRLGVAPSVGDTAPNYAGRPAGLDDYRDYWGWDLVGVSSQEDLPIIVRATRRVTSIDLGVITDEIQAPSPVWLELDTGKFPDLSSIDVDTVFIGIRGWWSIYTPDVQAFGGLPQDEAIFDPDENFSNSPDWWKDWPADDPVFPVIVTLETSLEQQEADQSYRKLAGGAITSYSPASHHRVLDGVNLETKWVVTNSLLDDQAAILLRLRPYFNINYKSPINDPTDIPAHDWDMVLVIEDAFMEIVTSDHTIVPLTIDDTKIGDHEIADADINLINPEAIYATVIGVPELVLEVLPPSLDGTLVGDPVIQLDALHHVQPVSVSDTKVGAPSITTPDEDPAPVYELVLRM